MNKKMLYCPKCQAMYEDGSQRFCTNEGARLLPYSTSEQSDQPSKGIFTSILNKSSLKKENSAKVSESSKTGNSFSAFQPPNKSKFFKSDENESAEEENIKESATVDIETNEPEDKSESKNFEHLPLAGIINPSQIPEKQIKTDKVFSKQTQKSQTSAKSTDIDAKSEDILETSEILKTNTPEDLPSTENDFELSFDEPFEINNTPDYQNDLELKLENQDSDSDFSLDLGIDEIPEDEFSLNLQDSTENIALSDQSTGVELDLLDLDDEISESRIPPKIELELDEIEGISIPGTVPELNLQSKKEINLENSLPKIELDLMDLEEVSIPDDLQSDLTGEEELPTPETVEFQESENKAESEDSEDEKVSSSAPILTDDSIVEESPENLETKETKETKETQTAAAALVETDEVQTDNDKVKATEESSWEKRSSDSSGNEESRWFLYPLIGIIVLGFGLLGYFYLTQNNSTNENPANSTQQSQSNLNVDNNLNLNANTNESLVNSNSDQLNSEIPPDSQSYTGERTNPKTGFGNPPSPRQIKQPPNTVLYRNERKTQKGELSENFLGFSIYYPKDWKESRADNKFLDISKKTPQGLPIKQLLISRYDSKGTFDADKAIFDDLVKQSNDDLRKILSNYQVISKGEATFQNGRWQVYEVDFQGIGSDKKLIIWGKRLWIPVQREGMKSGFIITMIGTSLSDDVKSVNDLGENDDLAEILKTFEPELNQ